MDKAMRMLYRRLLRRAAAVDDHPAVQLLFRKECHRLKDPQGKSESLYQRWLERLFGPGRCFMPADLRRDLKFHPAAGVGKGSRAISALKDTERPVTTSLRKTFRDGFELHRRGDAVFNRDEAIHAGLRIQRVLVQVLIAAEDMGLLKHQLSALQQSWCKGWRQRGGVEQAETETEAEAPRVEQNKDQGDFSEKKTSTSGTLKASGSFPITVPDPPDMDGFLASRDSSHSGCKWWIEALRETLGPDHMLRPSEKAMLKGFKPALQPSPGVFLIEHPLAESHVFCRSVIILTQHTSQGSSVGLTVNAPLKHFGPPFSTQTQFKWLQRTAGGEENFYYLISNGGFAYGGPSLSLLNVLHSKYDLVDPGVQLPQSLPSTQVYCGNSLKTAIDAIRQGTMKKSQFRPFWGAKTWQKHKLDEELAQGMWILVHAPANLAIEAASHDLLWEKLLLSMGPPYAELSLIPDDVRERVYAADGFR